MATADSPDPHAIGGAPAADIGTPTITLALRGIPLMVERGGNLIVALDYSSAGPAIELAEKLNPEQVRLKVGKHLFTHAGPDVVRKLHDLGFDIFLDHDPEKGFVAHNWRFVGVVDLAAEFFRVHTNRVRREVSPRRGQRMRVSKYAENRA